MTLYAACMGYGNNANLQELGLEMAATIWFNIHVMYSLKSKTLKNINSKINLTIG